METATNTLKRSRLENAIEDGEPLARKRLAEVEAELRRPGLSDLRRRELRLQKLEYEESLATLAGLKGK